MHQHPLFPPAGSVAPWTIKARTSTTAQSMHRIVKTRAGGGRYRRQVTNRQRFYGSQVAADADSVLSVQSDRTRVSGAPAPHSFVQHPHGVRSEGGLGETRESRGITDGSDDDGYLRCGGRNGDGS